MCAHSCVDTFANMRVHELWCTHVASPAGVLRAWCATLRMCLPAARVKRPSRALCKLRKQRPLLRWPLRLVA